MPFPVDKALSFRALLGVRGSFWPRKKKELLHRQACAVWLDPKWTKVPPRSRHKQVNNRACASILRPAGQAERNRGKEEIDGGLGEASSYLTPSRKRTQQFKAESGEARVPCGPNSV